MKAVPEGLGLTAGGQQDEEGLGAPGVGSRAGIEVGVCLV